MGNPTVQDFLNASKYVYNQVPGSSTSSASPPIGLKPLVVGGQQISQSIASDGFSAAAYTTTTGQIIIAYAGTVPGFTGFNGASLGADAAIATGSIPNALTDAASFAQQVITAAQQQGLDPSNIFVAGHSLGGIEAQYVMTQISGLGGGANFGGTGVPGYSNAGNTP